MPDIPEELAQRVSLLSAREKAQLALHLLESLEPAENGAIDEAWRQEAESRLDAVERGEAQTVSMEDVFAKLDLRQKPKRLSS
ncbi:addiction module antitoxin RelB [Duganella sp. FT80W]|uniref:Addiction module antitoxin RelB n=1 Tax=Duganella guangzhouensis TaxID=2666084 RepID=A0A6I2LDA5_9BURK|nr:addiction module protein [Duganella guangzhouensis]MRW94756.1 addiction module antitoxin RelB [Duganella guangzhouensis]